MCESGSDVDALWRSASLEGPRRVETVEDAIHRCKRALEGLHQHKVSPAKMEAKLDVLVQLWQVLRSKQWRETVRADACVRCPQTSLASSVGVVMRK